MRPFIVFSTFDMDQLGQKSIDTTGKSALKLVPNLKVILYVVVCEVGKIYRRLYVGGGASLCPSPPPSPTYKRLTRL